MLYGVTFGLAVAVAQRHKLLDDTPSSSLLWPRPLSALAAAAALAGVAGYAVFALYCGNREDCNEIHPYISFVPVSYCGKCGALTPNLDVKS